MEIISLTSSFSSLDISWILSTRIPFFHYALDNVKFSFKAEKVLEYYYTFYIISKLSLHSISYRFQVSSKNRKAAKLFRQITQSYTNFSFSLCPHLDIEVVTAAVRYKDTKAWCVRQCCFLLEVCWFSVVVK